MCGICGYYGVNRVLEVVGYDEIKNIVLSIEHRGKDATGIYCESVDKIYKAPLKPTVFFEVLENFNEFIDAIENSNVVVMHNRLSTSGSPEINRNNQPFTIQNYVFAHNGVYWFDYSEFYQKTIEKSKIDKISDNKIDNDSYELFKILFNSKLKINEKTIATAIENEYYYLNYAFSVYDTINNKLYLSRDDDKPLYYLTDNKKVLIYCSEDSYLKKLRKKLDLDLKLYKVNEYEIIKVEQLKNRLFITKYKIAIDKSEYTYINKKNKKSSKKKNDYYVYRNLYDDYYYIYYK